MAKSDLLKQAIADAKTVKETALANAKIALQEAFAPTIHRMFAEKLEADIMDDEEDVTSDETGVDAAAGVEGEANDDFMWTDNDLSAEVGGTEYNFQVNSSEEEGMPAEEMPAEEEPVESEEDLSAEYNEGNDLDLDEILRELEGDLDEEYEAEAEEETAVDPMMKMEGDYSEKEDDVNLDEIIEAILREEEEAAEEPAAEPTDVVEAMEAEMAEKDEELQEAYRTVKHLQSVINEVNLLNAKLLYTNKLFRNFELNEAQKMKVIENFDRAANTREAKLVFATLAESFAKPSVKKRVVKESYASKATATTAPSAETTQVLSEGFELANRWKKLAGLL